MGNNAPPALALAVDQSALRELISQAVEEAIAHLDGIRTTMPDKLAYGECEAARLLSLNPHQLRDERLRGRIKASVGPGKKVLYSREDLLAYLASRRWKAPA